MEKFWIVFIISARLQLFTKQKLRIVYFAAVKTQSKTKAYINIGILHLYKVLHIVWIYLFQQCPNIVILNDNLKQIKTNIYLHIQVILILVTR